MQNRVGTKQLLLFHPMPHHTGGNPIHRGNSDLPVLLHPGPVRLRQINSRNGHSTLEESLPVLFFTEHSKKLLGQAFPFTDEHDIHTFRQRFGVDEYRRSPCGNHRERCIPLVSVQGNAEVFQGYNRVEVVGLKGNRKCNDIEVKRVHF